FDLVYGDDDLQAKGDVGNLTVVLGNSDVASVRHKTETLKQILRHPELKAGVDDRSVSIGWVIGSYVGVVEPYQEIRAPLKALLVGEVSRAGVCIQDGYLGKHARRLRVVPVHL